MTMVESQERYNLREALRLLNQDLNQAPGKQRFDSEQLKALSISVQPMSLDRNSNDHPRFFAPYAKAPALSSETIKELKVTGMSMSYDKMRCDSRNMTKKDWPWFDIANGAESSEAMEVSVAAYGELPQIKAVILVNAEGDNKKFFRGEIMTVLRLIIYQMGQRRLIKHMKLPVQIPPILVIHQPQELTLI
ncbi:uncharacterized protein N7483_006680 [Penicillium malachiteum]|uniref:uncharacterized protein n=1 Tax=Penicillium malachiteum TaxID=1324776 RepID=UPI002549A1B5|nr:uncharacterized protein N7483_006680 [Penicillium malachiteum]KAJ5725323.1 hypothetical protein N7483_006680 [Penicillium malachiteum]